MSSRLVVGAVVATLVGGVLVAWLVGRSNVRTAPSARVVGPAVTTVRARAGSVADTVSATGRVGPPSGSDVKLAFPLPGIVATVAVAPGQRVFAGQTLATLDRRPFVAALAQAQADANAATATYAGGTSAADAARSARAKDTVTLDRLAALERGGPAALSDRISAVSAARQAALKTALDRRELERAQILFAGGVVAQKDVDVARTLFASDVADQRSADAKVAAASAGYAAALQQARADVAQAQSDVSVAQAAVGSAAAQRDSALARLASARTDYDRSVLGAPADGVVVAVLKHAGEAVDPTSPVVDVAPPASTQITLVLPGTDALRVRAGDPVSLTLSESQPHVAATVRAVVPAVDPTTQATTVIVNAPTRSVVGGQAVSAVIEVFRTSGTLVPASAVVTDPETGATVVFLRDRGSKDTPYVSRDVNVRANDGSSVIVSGIHPGDEVAAKGAYDLLAPSGG